MIPTSRLLVLAAPLVLLSLLAPFAQAAPGVCVGDAGPRACVNAGPCYGVGATTGATDFYPGAGVCKLPPGEHDFCLYAYAGFASLGGFYGPNALVCGGRSTSWVVCAGALGNWMDPVCL